MQIAIIDDESTAREVFVSLAARVFGADCEVLEADDVASGIELLTTHEPSIVFLDIQLRSGSGFDVLRALPAPTFHLVMTTAFDQYGVEAFSYAAVDYLLKPFGIKELQQTANRIAERIQRAANISPTALGNEDTATDTISLPLHHAHHEFSLKQIIRVEAQSSYSLFHFINRHSIIVAKTLKEYDQLLTSSGFCRVHHSHLVNLRHVTALRGRVKKVLVMSDKSEVPVARRRLNAVRKQLGK